MRLRAGSLLLLSAAFAAVTLRLAIRAEDGLGVDAPEIGPPSPEDPSEPGTVRLEGREPPVPDAPPEPRRAAEIHGRVLWEDGEPIEGALVLAFPPEEGTGVRTDGEGRFSVPRARNVGVEVGGTVRHRLSVAGGALEFRFPRPTVLEGVVEDEATGRPIEEATVWAVPEPEDSTTRYVRRVLERAVPRPRTATAGGRFRIEVAASAALRVHARAPGYRESDVLLLLRGPGPGTVRLRLREARGVRGRVVGPDGTGVEGASLSLVRRSDGEETPYATEPDDAGSSRADGAFALDGLEPGSYRLQCAGPGAFASVPFEVGHSDVDLDVLLAPVGSVTGRLRDADGRPVSRGQVEAVQPDGTHREATTTPTGWFELDQLRPGAAVLRWRSRQDRRAVAAVVAAGSESERRSAYLALRRAHGEIDVPSGGTVEVDVSMPTLVRLRGRFRIAGAAPEEAGTFELVAPGDEEELVVRYDPDGDFWVRLEAGTWTVKAPDAHRSVRESVLEVPAGAGSYEADIDR